MEKSHLSNSKLLLKIFKWIGFALLGLVVMVFLAMIFLDRPLGGYLEKRINSTLVGYRINFSEIDLNPLAFSITFHDLSLRQEAHPEPPILDVPRATVSLHWKELLTGNLVAECDIDQPIFHINLTQLEAEAGDKTELEEKGWQEAMKLYPLEINRLAINNATLTYIDKDPEKPIKLSSVDFLARNIQSIGSQDQTYPSSFRIEGDIFDKGHGSIEGSADFLAEPYPGIKAQFRFADIALNHLQPVTSRANVHIDSGILSGSGQVEFSSRIRRAELTDLKIADLLVDYVHSEATAEEEEKRADKARKILRKADKQWQYVVENFEIRQGHFGYVDRSQKPSYRLSLSGVDLQIANLSNRFHNGEARLTLDGQFMHSGDLYAEGTFRPEQNGPDFDMLVAIEGTQLTEMNDLLRAFAGIDVVEGIFTLYSEVQVNGTSIDGYAKPFFRNLDVYSEEQEEGTGVISQLKEGIVDMLGEVLQNPQDKVATQFDLDGTIEDPEAGTLEIILQLIRNAFFDAILPGFESSSSAGQE